MNSESIEPITKFGQSRKILLAATMMLFMSLVLPVLKHETGGADFTVFDMAEQYIANEEIVTKPRDYLLIALFLAVLALSMINFLQSIKSVRIGYLLTIGSVLFSLLSLINIHDNVDAENEYHQFTDAPVLTYAYGFYLLIVSMILMLIAGIVFIRSDRPNSVILEN
ncbi:MAG: hypothetical protein ACXAD7_09645 [Candidatus Kariarchaeaceae archaeon]|jgi:hypothetical protein